MAPVIVSVAIGMVLAETFATIMPEDVMPQAQPVICINFQCIKFGKEAATGQPAFASAHPRLD